ncbi:deoxyribonuclease-1-like 1 [Osmerus mordax]|uniref:deoxyribonuclease-1-like 1 n=1 Tax=Osmerus mordax TaxID=8014 RepID=UPI0035108C35
MQHLSAPPLLLLFSLLLLWGSCSAFKICAFNTQGFNSTKASKFQILNTLTKIVSRCDVCLLQGVRDPKGKATKALVTSLNRYNEHTRYKSVSSVGLGPTPTDKQQYVYLYRIGSVNITGQYQYPDTNNDFFREPFVLIIQSNKTDLGEIALVPLFSHPKNAVQEMDKLYDILPEVLKLMNTSNVMFLGDFKAGCGYMTRTKKQDIRLFTKPGFYWLIGDKVDTTIRDITNCPYDRIVVHGASLLKNIEPYSAKVFDFANEFKMTKQRVLRVSDHFPVEVKLRTPSSAQPTRALPHFIILSGIIWSSLHSYL